MKITRWVSLCAWTLVALAALVAARVQRRPRRLTWLLGVAGGSGLVAVFCFEDKLWPWLGNGAMLVLTLSTACLVVAFRWRELDGGAWRIRGTGWLVARFVSAPLERALRARLVRDALPRA